MNSNNPNYSQKDYLSRRRKGAKFFYYLLIIRLACIARYYPPKHAKQLLCLQIFFILLNKFLKKFSNK